jgi:hypothetical protein
MLESSGFYGSCVVAGALLFLIIMVTLHLFAAAMIFGYHFALLSPPPVAVAELRRWNKR